jgi:hypothetical protein
VTFKFLMLAGALALVAACGQPADNAASNAAAPAKKAKTPYCFFKDAETKGWSASTDKAGNVVVKGKAYRSDSRYKAVLGEPKVTGTTAEVRPTIVGNNTGYAAPDDWWDVTATIPNSAAVATVEVRCGKKVVADLKVPRKA